MALRFAFAQETWRSPLRLIDTWLPAAPEQPRERTQPAAWMARFAKAGWLQGAAPQAATPGVGAAVPASPVLSRPPALAHQRVRVVQRVEGQRLGGCIRISGRLSDVCAELDRLAALEGTPLRPH